ncbi:unnamed protein product [Parascedosporium putredinis]|uniref:Peptidase S33 tripeptidyl aminopeptidase-like C-terminal domain-containing protein n=1 Tax=Parascedosporium putredinis TaxID=1442378 RepID=A0A9P1MCA1_9PEZI|nr:unnamed protein product [Parascedosporium putredinis]CAI7997470.1 unnamed protein product [Parascedosporium putredinis]
MARSWSRFAILAGLALRPSAAAAAAAAPHFNWEDIEPSSQLRYTDCYDNFQCARLLVPLDWLDEENPTASPSPSSSSRHRARHRPGLRRPHSRGRAPLRNDWLRPRGVMHTTPRADCYPDLLTRATENLQAHGIGSLRTDNPRLAWRHALSRAYGQRCDETLGEDGGILGYASTASAKSAKPARLQYMGFSYGTLLGNTFASMFPGRVGRMIIDGVCDSEDYMAGTWLANLYDTDELIDALYKRCFDLGSKCALVKKEDKSWHDLKDKVTAALDHLSRNPVPIKTDGGTMLLGSNDINTLVFASLYKPSALFLAVAGVLDIVVQRDYNRLAFLLQALFPAMQTYCPLCVLPDHVPDSSVLPFDDWSDYFDQLRNQSHISAPIWAEIRFRCSGWTNRPKKARRPAPLPLLPPRPRHPVRNAFAMSARHPGSSVVIQESLGHCALASGVSRCTADIVRTYFETGQVPESGTVCEEDFAALSADAAAAAGDTAPVVPFGLPGTSGLSGEELMEKLADLSRVWAQGGWESGQGGRGSEAQEVMQDIEIGEL